MHHLRGDLSPEQISQLCAIALRYMHNPFLANTTTILATKITFQIIEVIIAKFTSSDAAKLIMTIMDSFIDKLESLVIVLTEVMGKYGRIQTEDTAFAEFALIEKARPVAGATYAVEKPEELVVGKLCVLSLPLQRVYLTFLLENTGTYSEPCCTPFGPRLHLSRKFQMPPSLTALSSRACLSAASSAYRSLTAKGENWVTLLKPLPPSWWRRIFMSSRRCGP